MFRNILIAVALIVVGVLILLRQSDLKSQEAMLAESSEQTYATILEKYEKTQGGPTGRARWLYYVHVQYTAQNGTPYQKRQQIIKTYYWRIKEGAKVPIRYATKDPTIIEFLDAETVPWEQKVSFADMHGAWALIYGNN